MYRFEPPAQGAGQGGSEPDNPYAAQQHPVPSTPSDAAYGRRSGPPWGPAGYNNHPQGTLALVLGILGVAGFPILAPVAWWIAARALRQTSASPYPVTNRGQLVASQVLGVIGTVLFAIVTIAMLLWAIAVVGLLAAG